jgi:hypothetical protein
MYILGVERVNRITNLCTHHHPSLVHCVTCTRFCSAYCEELDHSFKEWNMLYCVTLLGDVFYQHTFVRWLSGLGKKKISFHKNVCEVNWKLH